MDALKRFSLALMAAVVVTGTTPAFSQTRDTRPTEPDRPTIERSDDDNGEAEVTERIHRLPKGSPNISCAVIFDGTDFVEITVSNDTGKTIPAGTVITLYVQPGDVEKLYKLETDWDPGTEIEVMLKAGDIKAPARCSVRVKPERAERGLPQPEKDVSWYAAGDVDFECVVIEKYGKLLVQFKNTGEISILAGATFTYTLPWGQTVTYVLDGPVGAGSIFEVSLETTDEMMDYFNSGKPLACTFTSVDTGYVGPIVEDGGVPQIDPAKVP
jgi:hypothetical protein